VTDGPSAQTNVEPTPPSPVGTPADAALARYRRRMRPLQIVYAAGIVAVVVAALVIVRIAYSRGEISHATLHTVATPPSAVPSGAPAADLGKAWSSTDTTALGLPYSGGTVVTHDAHTVRGRNATTGKQTWSYTRTDRSVCAVMQSPYTYVGDKGDLVVAVYSLHGQCDEVTALDSQTGERRWTRTLYNDTAIFSGPASFFVDTGDLDGQDAYFYFVSSTSIYMINSSGYQGWTFHHVGCTINSAVGGTTGVLISQTCRGEDCGDAKYCGDGRQLLLRDGITAYDDSDKTNNDNPDQIRWNTLGSTLVPTAAGRTVAARDSNGATLHLLSDDKGKEYATLALTGSPAADAPTAVTTFSDADLIWLGGRTYALDDNGTTFRWSADTVGVPLSTDVATTPSQSLGSATLAVPTSDGVAFLAGGTGEQRSGYASGASPAGTVAYRYGTGFVLAGSSTAVLR